MKDTLIEIKDNIQGINSRADEAKNQVSNLEYKEAKNTQLEEQKEYLIQKIYEGSVKSLWDNFKHQRSHHRGAGTRRERGRH